MEELMAAAFECLLLNPGLDQDGWAQKMIEQYPAEVVDAIGVNPDSIMAELGKLWRTRYRDAATGIGQTYEDWARSFANQYSTGIYYRLVELSAKNGAPLHNTYKKAATD